MKQCTMKLPGHRDYMRHRRGEPAQKNATAHFNADITKDGNGDSIPDSPRGVPLLGDGDGCNCCSVGNKTGGN
jgi:hypothetical protein